MVDHASLTGSALHEPKGVATAATKTVYVANGAGSGSWTTLDYNSLPSGSVITFANAVTNAVVSGSTAIPQDNTIPQSTEGFEVLTCAITPKASGNKLLIRAVIPFSVASTGSDAPYSIALFKDSDANAIAAVMGVTRSAQGTGSVLTLDHVYTTTGTSAITFKIRIGGGSAVSVYVNGQQNSSTRIFGGVSSATISISEIKA